MISKNALAIFVLAGAVTASANAQVTTPPPPKPEAEPAYVPPPPPAPRPAPAQTDRQSTQSAPTPPHKALAQVDDNGKIIRLTEILDEVALQRNPFVSGAKNDAINAARVKRRAQAEQVVIENLDLFKEVESGILDEIKLADFEKFQRVVQKIPPLVMKGSLATQLADEGVITRIQSQSTNGIVREYNAAVSKELEKEYGEGYLDHFMKFIMNESLKDVRQAYAGLVEELLANAGDLEDAALSPNARKAVEAAAKLKGTADAAPLVRARMMGLDLEEHQELLRAIIARRADPTKPPLEMLDFKADEAVVIDEANPESRLVRVQNEDGSTSMIPFSRVKEGQTYTDAGKTFIRGQEKGESSDD